MGRYNVYNGEFICQECGAKVTSIRSYPTEKKLTWMCKDRHVSEVNLNTKKKKADYE